MDKPADIILISCVKTKRCYAAKAKDLYGSKKHPLFKYRRKYAERVGCPWYVLSAKHGLLHPDEWIEPYECALKGKCRPVKCAWAERTLEQITAELPPLCGKVIELHAGIDYVEFGLEDGLRKKGAIVRRPLKGKKRHEHIPWYKEWLGSQDCLS